MASTVGSRYANGRVTSTGAVINIRTVGFVPRYVMVTNLTTFYSEKWLYGMADDSALEITIAGAVSLETSDMITPLSANSSGDMGFAIGARANINDTTTEVLAWEAIE